MGCDVVQFGRKGLGRDCYVDLQLSCAFLTRAVLPFGISATIYQHTRRHIPQERGLN